MKLCVGFRSKGHSTNFEIHGKYSFIRHHGGGKEVHKAPQTIFNKPKVPGIQHIIAVASGKGGVGKSTTAVNLALAIASQNKRVALLDADIYGPSVPLLMNLNGKPDVNQEKLLVPKINYGIKCMSMGFLVEKDSPMIWRGPMVMGALEQMLRQTEWGSIDVMVVDLPPGTGDAQLSLCQRTPLSGAVIVCTPQDLALLDAVRGINMFRKVQVPVTAANSNRKILGLIENMSYHVCDKCGGVSHIFGHGGVKETATKMDIPFLGGIPLDTVIRESSDQGKPIVVTQPRSLHAKVYQDIAGNILEKLNSEEFQKQEMGPKISIE